MSKQNYSFSYTDYETFGVKIKKIKNPSYLNFTSFIKNTSIATSTMMIKERVFITPDLLIQKFVKIIFSNVNF